MPVSLGLLHVKGQYSNPVKNIAFVNINFAFSAWLGPSTPSGYVPTQAGIHRIICSECKAGYAHQIAPGAIEIEYAQNIEIRNSVIHRHGGNGVNIGKGTFGITMTGNQIFDISGGGVAMGYFSSPGGPIFDVEEAARSNRFVNNLVSQTGVEFFDSVGIFLGYVKDTEVSYNTVQHLPYSGISAGWGWSYEFNFGMQNNNIVGNKVDRAMQMLVDGAGIYLMSRQDGTKISNNYITNVGSGLEINGTWAVRRSFHAPSVPIYLDQGASEIVVHNNVFQSIPYRLIAAGTFDPVFGPRESFDKSPCGAKACNIDELFNRFYGDGNRAHDNAIVNGAGWRP